MKSLLILILIVALAAAAFFTRPSEADFSSYILAQKTQGQSGIVKVGWAQLQADQYVKSCTFNNRLLWVDVQKDGQTIYTGAFSHFFNRAQVAQDVNAVKDKIDTIKIEKK